MHAFATERPFVEYHTTTTDLVVASVAFGWTMGFEYFVCIHALKQTKKLSVYTALVWTEIAACTVYALISWLHILGKIEHSLGLYFAIVLCWATQVQCLLQIIINRICLLWMSRKKQRQLKFGVAGLILLVNISVFCIWIPARLQINEKYISINNWWDRVEKCIYLIVDAILNWTYIRTVNQQLLSVGLERYRPLVRFNKRIIFLSISMDVLIIAMMSYPNTMVYNCFHSVAYMVKLNIELSMSSLVIKIVKASNPLNSSALAGGTNQFANSQRPSIGLTLRRPPASPMIQVSVVSQTMTEDYEDDWEGLSRRQGKKVSICDNNKSESAFSETLDATSQADQVQKEKHPPVELASLIVPSLTVSRTEE
ncbi:hypothetical protein T439DRAFT_309544 [Meredithblackwellia eburnea MCA 4105]